MPVFAGEPVESEEAWRVRLSDGVTTVTVERVAPYGDEVEHWPLMQGVARQAFKALTSPLP